MIKIQESDGMGPFAINQYKNLIYGEYNVILVVLCTLNAPYFDVYLFLALMESSNTGGHYFYWVLTLQVTSNLTYPKLNIKER